MAIVRGKQARWRVFGAHALLWVFLALTLFPLLAVVSISLRPGNFATGSLIPTEISLEHWKLALGHSLPGGRRQPGAAALPGADAGCGTRSRWPGLAALPDRRRSRPARPTPSRGSSSASRQDHSQRHAAAADVPAGAGPGGHLRHLRDPGQLPAGASVVETHAGLVLAYLGGIATHVWTIKGYFETIPVEIEENAKVDGATHWQAFSLRAAAHGRAHPDGGLRAGLHRRASSNTRSPPSCCAKRATSRWRSAPSTSCTTSAFLWGDFAAAAVLSGLPITAVFLFAQRWIVSGLTAGGVKG